MEALIVVSELDFRGLIDLETEIFDHTVCVGRLLAGRGEIAVDENRIGGEKAQRLQRA